MGADCWMGDDLDWQWVLIVGWVMIWIGMNANCRVGNGVDKYKSGLSRGEL